MLRKFTAAFFTLLIIPALNHAQSTAVVPSAYESTNGNASLTNPLSNAANSYQMLIDSTLITNLMNSNITGIAFKRNVNAPVWPSSTITYSNYDIYMGGAVLIQNSTNNTFATNQSGIQTQVRSGSFTININDYPAGGVNSWGPPITFNSDYYYAGGNLSILFRHDASNGSSRSNNAMSTTSFDYGRLFKACSHNSYAGAGNTQANFSVIKLFYTPTTLPVTLISFTATASGHDARLNWETASEKNMKSYVIEAGFDGVRFEAIHTILVNQESNTVRKYSYNDYDIFKRNETVFYRLKMVEADGSFKYSKINKVNIGKVFSGNLVVYPNPVTSVGNISYDLPADAYVSLQIVDIAGKVVYNDGFKSQKGGNAILTNLNHLEKGCYVLKLSSEGGLEDFYKFVKK